MIVDLITRASPRDFGVLPCSGSLHSVRVSNGQLLLAHDIDSERSLAALGGTDLPVCALFADAWADGFNATWRGPLEFVEHGPFPDAAELRQRQVNLQRLLAAGVPNLDRNFGLRARAVQAASLELRTACCQRFARMEAMLEPFRLEETDPDWKKVAANLRGVVAGRRLHHVDLEVVRTGVDTIALGWTDGQDASLFMVLPVDCSSVPLIMAMPPDERVMNDQTLKIVLSKRDR